LNDNLLQHIFHISWRHA